LAALRQNLSGEVQPRRGGGGRAFFTRENRLVALAVAWFIGALDVWRQRNVANALERPEKVLLTVEADGALPQRSARNDLRFEAARKGDVRSDPQRAPGTDQRLPLAAIGRFGPQQQNFHRPEAARPVPKQPR